MNKIVYFVLLFFVFLFISACKNENQNTKVEKKTTDINTLNNKGKTILHLIAMYSNNPDDITTLIEKGADINIVSGTFTDNRFPKFVFDRLTPLHFAAWLNRNSEITTTLIKKGADINAQDDEGKTPLHFAVWINNSKIITILIKTGANVEARDRYGSTPLFEAAKFNKNSEIAITTLVKAGANVNARDKKYGDTPLHWANNAIVVNTLLKFGADIEARNTNTNSTPLHIAGLRNNSSVFDALIKAGANANALDYKGKKPSLNKNYDI